MQNIVYRSQVVLFALLLQFPFIYLHAGNIQLPELGDAGSGIISPAQEYELGQKWLRVYRSQIATSSDPFLQAYVERLVNDLVKFSDLNDKRLSILVVQNPTLNAFAVPGGVVGVHTGLFNYAENEQQFSSVIAHELAHLSQRHYARKVEKQKNSAIPTMAALLASIFIAATAGGDAGIAAISSVQAASIDAQLRFSRQMEQEADRVGMEIMVRSGMNPYAMSEMFEQMLKSTRFQKRPPEFLLTHPVTESRVAESKLRSQQFPRKQFNYSLEYQLVKTRAAIEHEANAQTAVQRFKNASGVALTEEIARYGLTLALTKAQKYDEARKAISSLLAKSPDNIFYIVALAEIEAHSNNYDKAIALVERKLLDYPNNHALNVRYAEFLMRSGRYKKSEEVLSAHVKRHPKDDYIWYLLAEVHGLAGHILDVHIARAEYFILNGLFEKADIQLRNAQKLVKDDRFMRAKIDEKLKTVRELQKDNKI